MWREAYALLRERADRARELVRAAAAMDLPALPFHPRGVRTVITTGVGSSAAHATLLAHLLAVEVGLPARFVPAGAFIAPRPATDRDVLVVFSQGLSPNARLALAAPEAWGSVVLVTAVGTGDAGAGADKLAARAAVERAGGVCVEQPGGTEYGTLLRMAGPLAGYAIAFRLAEAIGRGAGIAVDAIMLDAEAICARMRAAAARVVTLGPHDDPFVGRIVFLASGGYGVLAGNLALKVQEALLEPAPLVSDLIEFAHGPFQALYERDATFLLLQRGAGGAEGELLARLRPMLDPQRHHLVSLPAESTGASALFEHEALLNELVLRAIAARRIDQARWPGRDRERALYDVAAPDVAANALPASPQAAADRARGRSLGTLTWPEVEALIAAGCRTAVLPLGATEQHGPHLPLAADTWIADALAERFCARVAEAVRVPALALGCSAEHAAFPGTLSLRAETLRALAVDVVTSLAAHGFEHVFLFTAHGGNDGALRDMLPELRRAAQPARVIAFTGIDALSALWHAAARAAGVEAGDAGHHAGEFETSIVLGLRADAVRRDRLAAGLTDVGADPQAVFYPSLRAHSPSGVVGDPRRASGARAERYLAAWVDALVAAYRREKNEKNTNGVQNA
jgi:creatinine amidohydrolase